ncbi:MAG: UDP-glucose/GDP-mannose dehydrogenase family protein, partial [Caulobacteraceae bacterium]|nr:UDP-glucose/GDP-mannose dehydrogenase family protein [Caulobacteraceae bacterium]
GAGYVGLVTSTCLADFGHEVVCVDKQADKVSALRLGRMPIYEPGLSELVLANQAAGRLTFSTSLAEAMKGAKAVFIAVGTPSLPDIGAADLSFVHAAAREVADLINDFTVVVVKSTVPIGSCDEVERIIAERIPRDRFAVVSNPEFLREGAAIEDFKHPDRIVVGVEDVRAEAVMREVYQPLQGIGGPLVVTSRHSSEMIKYAANVFLAMKVTFINEVADLCERVDADVVDVARGIGLDDRIGPRFLNPGPGFGGSCFPKDTLAITKLAMDSGSPIRLVETLVDVNKKRMVAMARKIQNACGGSVAGKRIAVLGLTYKPKTDDMRDAPSLVIVPELQAAGATIVAYDPEGTRMARTLLAGVEFAENAYACLEGADAAAIITEWDEFRALDLRRVKAALATPVIVDLRNICPIRTMRDMGFRYVCVGRGLGGEG